MIEDTNEKTEKVEEPSVKVPVPMYFPPSFTTKVEDKVTGRKGVITHALVFGSGQVFYNFAPEEINQKTKLPAHQDLLDESRVGGVAPVAIPASVPLQIIGTKVRDLNTGIEGTVTRLILHGGGCVHLSLQQCNVTNHKGELVPQMDFDIRRCRGEVLTDAVVNAASKPTDSPEGYKSKLGLTPVEVPKLTG